MALNQNDLLVKSLIIVLRRLSVLEPKVNTSVVQNSSSSVNISEGLDEDDNEVLKILNEFLNTSDEASVSPNVHRNRLDTFIHTKKNVTTTDLSGNHLKVILVLKFS